MLLTRRFLYLSMAIIFHLIVFAVQQGSTKHIQNNNLETNNNIDGVDKESLNENDLRCNCRCGLPNSINFRPRIVNGTMISKNQFPWMVHLQISYSLDDKIIAYNCGGSLINDRYVLTAAHCVGSEKGVPPTVKVTLRMQNRCKEYEENTLTRKVADIIKGKYDSKTNFNDIALLKLEKTVPITEHTIRPICLPNDSDDYGVDDMLTVIGWGADRHNGAATCELMRVDLPVYDHNECSKVYKNINDDIICAGHKEGGKDACQGDSGGPLMKMTPSGRYSIAGIVSSGKGCARPNSPGKFTRVNHFMQFIRRNTKDACYCSE